MSRTWLQLAPGVAAQLGGGLPWRDGVQAEMAELTLAVEDLVH